MPHDIFVSYAHADNEASGTAAHGSVTTFVEELRKALYKKIGVRPTVWMDHQLAANERVAETLELHVRGSRCLLLFMSPGYLRSTWCASELQQFLSHHGAVFNRENVFVVAVEETDRSQWPARVQELTPLELFEKDIKGVTKTLGWPYPPQDPTSMYWSRVNELAHFIRNQLARVAATAVPAVAAVAAPVPKLQVWIAQPTTELREPWERLAGALRQAGATVLPSGSLVYPQGDGNAFKLAVTRDLMAADMLVQLLGADAGPLMGAGPLDRSALVQHELARVLKGQQFERLMRWRHPDAHAALRSDDPEPYQRLLLGATAGSFEQFRSLVVAEVDRQLRPAPAVVPPSALAASAGELTVCVTAAEPDRGLAQDVCSVVQGLGAVPIAVGSKPSQGQSLTEYREQFEGLLDNVDGVILVHGTAPAMWLHSRYAQVRKVFAPRQRALWGAFLDGPPQAKEEAVACEGPGLMTLSCRTGVSASGIQQFLQRLRPGSGDV